MHFLDQVQERNDELEESDDRIGMLPKARDARMQYLASELCRVMRALWTNGQLGFVVAYIPLLPSVVVYIGYDLFMDIIQVPGLMAQEEEHRLVVRDRLLVTLAGDPEDKKRLDQLLATSPPFNPVVLRQAARKAASRNSVVAYHCLSGYCDWEASGELTSMIEAAVDNSCHAMTSLLLQGYTCDDRWCLTELMTNAVMVIDCDQLKPDSPLSSVSPLFQWYTTQLMDIDDTLQQVFQQHLTSYLYEHLRVNPHFEPTCIDWFARHVCTH
jgi:hypothetical protein